MVEPSVASPRPGERYQFQRKGYYIVDPVDSRHESPVFNRIVSLRDTRVKVRDEQGEARPLLMVGRIPCEPPQPGRSPACRRRARNSRRVRGPSVVKPGWRTSR